MTSASLTQHDSFILEKIKDPEAGFSPMLIVDPSLPRDPHLTDPETYRRATDLEREIISNIQQIELQIAGLKSVVETRPPLTQYLSAVRSLDAVIEQFPNYASARNNRAQALRRVYGDRLLVKNSSADGIFPAPLPVLDSDASDDVLLATAYTVITDLSNAITLLTPSSPFAAISPQSAKTLSQAYTQRGAIYHMTAKALPSEGTEIRVGERLKESTWTNIDFEENASRDFMLGGKYGNEVAKALAVATNPAAKLCGEMVKQAMRKEFAVGSSKGDAE